jgi:hypothetical protein
MDDELRRAGIRRLVEALNTRDMEPFDAIYHDDVVIEWPQSGEVIRGQAQHPGASPCPSDGDAHRHPPTHHRFR